MMNIVVIDYKLMFKKKHCFCHLAQISSKKAQYMYKKTFYFTCIRPKNICFRLPKSTGYNQSVTGCGSRLRRVVVAQRKLMQTA